MADNATARMRDRTPCRLIAIDGRALIDLSLRVSFTEGEGEPARFPVRIGLERDHAVVLTGFGAHQPTASAALHRNLVRAVERAFDDGVANAKRLQALAEKIAAFARANQETEHATMLKDDEDGSKDDQTGDAGVLGRVPDGR